MSSTATPQPSRTPTKTDEKVLIRPWPKVIFLYPTLAISLVGWIATLLTMSSETSPDHGYMGLIWCGVFSFNLLIFAFDFSRIKSITLFVAAIGLVFVGLWANQNWGFLSWFQNAMAGLDIHMNGQFYAFFSIFFCFMFLLVFINTRFNYYEVNRNEILHHHGYLGDIIRTPTTSMNMQKEIYDLMEYLLLRSGRLIFYPATKRDAIVIDNVVNISKIEVKIKNLLSSVSVAIDIDQDHGVNVPM